MFTSLFSRKNTAKSVLFFVFAAAFMLGTTACKQATDDSSSGSSSSVTAIDSTDGIVGTWTSSSSDYYTVSASTVTYYDGGYGYDWSGTACGEYKTNSTSGYIYVEYTSVGSALSSSLKGAYIAISYTGLATSSVKMATAYKSSGASSESTLSDAIKEYTIDNGYYSYYGTYSK